MQKRSILIDVFFFSIALTTARAASLQPLAQSCTNLDQRACDKLQKELRHCKDLSECTSALASLPDPMLNTIAEDSKIDPKIVGSAHDILDRRSAEREIKEAEARAIRARRKANFAKLHNGMTLDEVEATIGTLKLDTKISTMSFSEYARSMGQLGNEVHFAFHMHNGQFAMDSRMMNSTNGGPGGTPDLSEFIWDTDECRLVFDHQFKLTEFIYLGGQ